MSVLTTFIILFALLFFPNSQLSAFNFIKHSSSPIINPGPQSWNSNIIGYPTIIYEDNIYKMWYGGHNGTNWSIGYATSVDGITWTKQLSNPVVFNNSEPKNLHTPRVIRDGNIYKMWFTAETSNSSSINIGYSESQDGISWSVLNYDIFSNFNQTDYGSGAAATPTVLHINSKYYIWFISPDHGPWSVGFSSSNDGINWIPYANNPVLQGSGDINKEGTQLGGLYAVYDGTLYELWYSSNFYTSSSITYINYATSLDGISWQKPSEHNPVLSTGPSNSFDSDKVSSPFVIPVNQSIFLYYTATGTYNNTLSTRIGLATDSPIPTTEPTPTTSPSPTPTPSPTPSPTPTSTPTPTPSPTPTPTPTIPVRKVVILPGLGGSWNREALLNCKSDNYAGNWRLMPWDALDVYPPIINAIGETGMIPLPFYYDWRRDPRETAAKLDAFIRSNTLDGEYVYMVGHSLGGLVERAYVERVKEHHKVKKMITAGSPFEGALMAYPAWSGGEIRGDDIRWLISGNLAKMACRTNKWDPRYDKYIIRKYFPSVGTILPTFDYLKRQGTNTYIPVQTMEAQNTWLPNNSFTAPFYGIQVATIIGNNQTTPSMFVVRPQRWWEQLLGIWRDGSIVRQINSITGDNTVLTRSSTIPDATPIPITATHAETISSDTAIDEILNFFTLTRLMRSMSASSTAKHTKIDSVIAIASDVPDSIQVETDDGNVIKDIDGLMIISNPKKGQYKLLLKQLQKNKRLFVVQIHRNGEIFSKDFTIPKAKQFIKKFRFDPDIPKIDINE